MHVVGDISSGDVISSLAELGQRWSPKPVNVPEPQYQTDAAGAGLYFVDVPDAPQSVIRAGYMAMAQTDPDFYPATVMNHQLGGGITSRLFQILRIQNGFTYGARSGFAGTTLPGPFTVSTSVRANVTLESMELIKEILEGYGDTYSEVDLLETKNAMIRSNFVNFETLDAQLAMLQNIGGLGLPRDYVSQREAIVAGMSVTAVQAMANQYLNDDQMTYVVVGDAATQLSRLAELGYGEPIQLDRQGNPVP
jgi:zinc protease